MSYKVYTVNIENAIEEMQKSIDKKEWAVQTVGIQAYYTDSNALTNSMGNNGGLYS